MSGCRRAVVFSCVIATVGAIALSSQIANQASIVFSFPLGNYAALPTALAVDAAGNSYVAGVFSSCCTRGFPVSADAVQKDPASMFVAKIDASGSRLVWATYLGGHKNRNWYWRGALDTPSAIAVDPQGNVYVAGSTAATDFPTMNANQHAMPMMATLRVLGIEPTSTGLRIAPHVPNGSYALRTELVDLRLDGTHLTGVYRPISARTLEVVLGAKSVVLDIPPGGAPFDVAFP